MAAEASPSLPLGAAAPNESTFSPSPVGGAYPVSVVIPTLNEATNIAHLLIRLDQALTSAGIYYEAIIVDDHSTDGTPVVVETVARERNLPVRVLIKQGKSGKSFSLMEGIAVARFDALAIIDGDLQYPPEALPEMLRQLWCADIVVGDRRKSYGDVSRLRGTLSHIFTDWIVNWLFTLDTDMQSGLKVFRRTAYESVVSQPSRWSFDLHLITQAVYKGAAITNVPIAFCQRLGGQSKVMPLAVGVELVITALKLKTNRVLGTVKSSYRNRDRRTTMYSYASPYDEVLPQPYPPVETPAQQVLRYTDWLAKDARHNAVTNTQERRDKYLEEAIRPIVVGQRQMRPFAPFRHKHSALHTLTSGQTLCLLALALACALGLIFFTAQTLVSVLTVITVFYVVDLCVNFFLAARTLNHSVEERIDDGVVRSLANAEWPRYTVLCPLYREAEVVPQFIQAMLALDYPADKLQILLLTEADDTRTRAALEALSLPSHFTILTAPAGAPRTKPRACNFGLLKATGDYIVIYDAEDVPDPLQLKKAVLTFANHGSDLACVQAKLNFYNKQQNVLTRWFTAEYSSWFDLVMPGLQQSKAPLPLGGTSNHFRTEILRALGAWDAFNVTEDCDLGLRLSRYQLKTAMLDSTTYEEANSQVKNWLRQRSRWIKGYMQTYLVHMRQPSRYLTQKHLRQFVGLQLVIGGRTAVLFVNPLMWALVLLYILFHSALSGFYQMLFPAPLLYLGTICLIFGNFFFIYTYLMGCLRRGQYNMVKWALLAPVYWAMMSVAAFIALYQLIRKPHFWEKTQHGLHLRGPGAPNRRTVVVEETQPITRPIPLPPKTSGPSSPQGSGAAHVQYRPALAMLGLLGGAALITGRALAHRLPERYKGRFRPRTLLMLPAMGVLVSVLPFLAIFQRGSRPKGVSHVRLSGARSASSITSVTDALKLVEIAPHRMQSNAQTQPMRARRLLRRFSWPKDRWLVATLVTACVASLASFSYFFSTHQILLYGDAYSHLDTARRVFDNATPGFAQLGGVWLPLPHLLILPFVWNDYLWHSGVAGSFPSMVCYVFSAVYLFLSVRRLTGDSRASFVGALLFILNPNILYLQTTPLSELVLIATLTAATYYFIAWVQEEMPRYLVWAAGATFLATMARYDGWALFVAMLILIPLVGRLKHQRWAQIEGNLLVFGSLGGLGIALWFFWCAVIFGNPLYFQNGLYSSQAQQQGFIQANLLYTDHNFWQSLRTYVFAASETVGPILLALSSVALVLFVVRRRFSASALAALLFLVPAALYIVSLYSGQAALFVPGAVPAHAPYDLFNARYGVMAVVPAAVFLATLASRMSVKQRRLQPLAQLAVVVAICVQTGLTASGGVISLQDGQSGLSCAPAHPIVLYLAQHYNGGSVLEDLFTSKISATEAGIDFRNMVYEGSNQLWQKALAHPATTVDWVIMRPEDPTDLVAQRLGANNPAFQTQFSPVVREPDGLTLYYRNGLPLSPAKAVSSTILTDHHLCGAGAGSTFLVPPRVPANLEKGEISAGKGAMLGKPF